MCKDCVPALGAPIPSRCFGCSRQTEDFRVCESCKASVPVQRIWTSHVYAGCAKALIKEFKFNGKRGAAQEIARHMKDRLPRDSKAILVHIPTATDRIRERGYDHAKLLSSALAKETGLLHLSLLARTSQKRQVGLRRAERLKNISNSFRINGDVAGAHIILVDDVVTTGATLGEAAKVLRAVGAKRVDAVVFAQTIL